MHRLSISAALVLGTALSTPALALEAEPFAERLKAAMTKSGYDLTYENASLDGSNVTLSGVVIGFAAGSAPEGVEAGEMPSFPAGDVTFEDVTEADEGGYRVGRIGRTDVSGQIPEVGGEDEPASFTIGEWAIEGLRVPGENATGISSFINAERYFVRDVEFDLDGEKYVTLASAEATGQLDANPYTSEATVEDMVVDLGVVADESPELKSWIEGTGYQTLTLDGEFEGSWNGETGEFDVPTYRITLEDMGTFDLSMSLGGMTEAFIEQLMAMSEASSDPQQTQAMQMQMMGLVAQMSFGGFEIGYEDSGMGDKLLDYYAERNGQTRDELVQQTVGVLPLALAQLQSPELQAQITEAVTSFLNDPNSIRISMNPDAPVAFPVLMGAAATSPGQVLSALNAQVTANTAGGGASDSSGGTDAANDSAANDDASSESGDSATGTGN